MDIIFWAIQCFIEYGATMFYIQWWLHILLDVVWAVHQQKLLDDESESWRDGKAGFDAQVSTLNLFTLKTKNCCFCFSRFYRSYRAASVGWMLTLSSMQPRKYYTPWWSTASSLLLSAYLHYIELMTASTECDGVVSSMECRYVHYIYCTVQRRQLTPTSLLV